ncbi:unnamed protein product [Orchesella dallaii]|uniref:Uncharacterized protein n=1 Tax=Orchesella dallaii TaxID=48710 RepID=A0ABP1Q983_9HEXA
MAQQCHPCASVAWVTSALDEKTAEKAIVLAGSLKRVQTRGKLVVIISSTIPENHRDRLYEIFDLVQLMQCSIANGVTSEDKAKAFAFSICLFKRCVYLSPTTLVLRRCDELFEFPTSESTIIRLPKSENQVRDSSVFCFSPSTIHFQTLNKIIKGCSNKSCNNSEGFVKIIGNYAHNNQLEIGEMPKLYNQRITVEPSQRFDGCIEDLAIINFGDIDPKLIFQDMTSSASKGLLESVCVLSHHHYLAPHLRT